MHSKHPFTDLKRMFGLFGRVANGLAVMRDLMSSYVRETGKAIVNDEEKAKEQGSYVQCLLDLKDKYDKLLSAAFNNDKTFQHSLNQVQRLIMMQRICYIYYCFL
jgi:cullin 3